LSDDGGGALHGAPGAHARRRALPIRGTGGRWARCRTVRRTPTGTNLSSNIVKPGDGYYYAFVYGILDPLHAADTTITSLGRTGQPRRPAGLEVLGRDGLRPPDAGALHQRRHLRRRGSRIRRSTSARRSIRTSAASADR
jgi:hypothetical protein